MPKGNGLPALAVALALAALACLGVACGGATRFSPRLPPDLIDVSRWEKLAGSAGIVSARLDVEYELYVSPQRPNVYSVTRYRITPWSAREPSHEKLQWDRDGRDVRRYECAPETPSLANPCQWRELPRGGAEYIGELGGLLSIYNLHVMLVRQGGENAGRLELERVLVKED